MFFEESTGFCPALIVVVGGYENENSPCGSVYKNQPFSSTTGVGVGVCAGADSKESVVTAAVGEEALPLWDRHPARIRARRTRMRYRAVDG